MASAPAADNATSITPTRIQFAIRVESFIVRTEPTMGELENHSAACFQMDFLTVSRRMVSFAARNHIS